MIRCPITKISLPTRNCLALSETLATSYFVLCSRRVTSPHMKNCARGGRSNQIHWEHNGRNGGKIKANTSSGSGPVVGLSVCCRKRQRNINALRLRHTRGGRRESVAGASAPPANRRKARGRPLFAFPLLLSALSPCLQIPPNSVEDVPVILCFEAYVMRGAEQAAVKIHDTKPVVDQSLQLTPNRKASLAIVLLYMCEHLIGA
jgi:hypothetical protein